MASPLKTLQKFREGATSATRRYRLKENGAAKDLTGFTAVKLYATKEDGTDIAAITGSIVSPSTSGFVDVDHVSIAAAAGTYVAEVEATNPSGNSYTEDAFLIDVRKKAADMKP